MQKYIADYLRQNVETNLKGALVSVHEVRVSDDLRHAGIYVSIHSEKIAESDIQRAVVRSLPRLRKHVAQNVRMRQLPEFRFFWDDTLERADRIEQLLNKIHNSQSPENEEISGDS